MTQDQKFYLCVWALVISGLVTIAGMIFVSSRQETSAVTERIEICVKNGGQWRPIQALGTQGTWMGCVRSDGMR